MSVPADTQQLLQQVRSGDRSALDKLLARHRAYLQKLVELRLDRRLRARLDVSDIVQEAQLEAARRLDGYLADPALPFRLWIRQIAHDRLLMARRRHVEAARRAVGRELPLPGRSSFQLARQLLGNESTPSKRVARRELAERVRTALAQLRDPDREVLLMRNFEGLSNQEVAQVFRIDPATASKRYGRALLRLHKHLLEGGMTESPL